jgi:hypothetical protein
VDSFGLPVTLPKIKTGSQQNGHCKQCPDIMQQSRYDNDNQTEYQSEN